MQIEFTIPLEPFSVNSMYGRDKRHKTQAYKDWEMGLLNYLAAPRPQKALEQLRTAYKDGEHCFYVEFEFHYPGLLNKQGTISSRCEDLSNVEKPLLDILFLPKFHVQPFPYGCQNINVDDKYVTKLISHKLHSSESQIVVRIELAPAPKP